VTDLSPVDVNADRSLVGLGSELGLAHELMTVLALAAADGVERVLVVALADHLDVLAARQHERLLSPLLPAVPATSANSESHQFHRRAAPAVPARARCRAALRLSAVTHGQRAV
jgi:hypothetical protein